MKKAFKTVETVKTILIIVLFVLSIFMVFLHFDILRNKNEQASDASDFGDMVGSATGESSNLSSVLKSTLLPCAIGVKNSENKLVAISSGSSYMREVYSLLDSSIELIFSKGCIAADEPDQAAFYKALESTGYIYISYHETMPAVLIYLSTLDAGYSSSSVPVGNLTKELSIKELIIFPHKNSKGDQFALSRTVNGETTSYTLSNDIKTSLHIDDFDMYKEAGAMASASFFGEYGKSNIHSSTLLYSLPHSYYKINSELGAKGLTNKTAEQAIIAELLDINPNKTGNYFDTDIGGTVYMSTHGTLTFCDDKITYSTENNANGGIHLSFYSGKAEGDEHTLYEVLTIVESIARHLNTGDKTSDLLGGEAVPQITNLYRKDGRLIIEYEYYYDNIPIWEIGTALKFEISENKITYFELLPMHTTIVKEAQQKSISPNWVVNIMNGTIKDDSLYTISYKYVNTKENIYEAEWIPIKINIK